MGVGSGGGQRFSIADAGNVQGIQCRGKTLVVGDDDESLGDEGKIPMRHRQFAPVGCEKREWNAALAVGSLPYFPSVHDGEMTGTIGRGQAVAERVELTGGGAVGRNVRNSFRPDCFPEGQTQHKAKNGAVTEEGPVTYPFHVASLLPGPEIPHDLFRRSREAAKLPAASIPAVKNDDDGSGTAVEGMPETSISRYMDSPPAPL